MRLTEEIKKHLYIEFRYNTYPNGDKLLFEDNWKNKLWESKGVIPNLDSYCDAVSDSVNALMEQWNGEGDTTLTTTLTKADFPFETFFDTITIPVFLILMSSEKNCRYSGAYISGKSGWMDGKYHVQMGNLTIKGNPKMIPQRIKISFAHEITHAYDDFKRRRMVKRQGVYVQSGDDLLIHNRKTGLGITDDLFYDDETEFSKEMGNLLYFIDNAEINAFIGQLRHELLYLMKGANNSQDAWNALRKTRTYKEIEALAETMETLTYLSQHENEYPVQTSHLLSLFNKTREKNIGDEILGVYPNRATRKNPERKTVSTPVKTFGKMVNVISKKFERLKDRFLTQGSKIAFDVYKLVGDKGM